MEVEGIDYTNKSSFCLYGNVLCVYNADIIDDKYVIYLQLYVNDYTESITTEFTWYMVS